MFNQSLYGYEYMYKYLAIWLGGVQGRGLPQDFLPPPLIAIFNSRLGMTNSNASRNQLGKMKNINGPER